MPDDRPAAAAEPDRRVADDAVPDPHSANTTEAAVPKPRVLLVEDEMIVAMMLEETLLDEGYAVVGPAGRLDRAMALAREADIDAALLDVNLHGEAVWPVARVLAGRGIAFAFLTGYGNEGVAAELAGWDVLTKPFQARAMLDMLRRLLGGHPAPAAWPRAPGAVPAERL